MLKFGTSCRHFSKTPLPGLPFQDSSSRTLFPKLLFQDSLSKTPLPGLSFQDSLFENKMQKLRTDAIYYDNYAQLINLFRLRYCSFLKYQVRFSTLIIRFYVETILIPRFPVTFFRHSFRTMRFRGRSPSSL